LPLLLLFPFAEIYLFYKFIQAYSFLDAVFLVVLSSILGSLIIRLQGASTFTLMQRDLAQGKLPANQLLHRSFVILGGILLFIPGILSDVMAIFCILPGTRHLMVWYFKRMIARGAFKGRVFMGGLGGLGGFGGMGGGPGMGGMGGRSAGGGRFGGFSRGGPAGWDSSSRSDEPRVERDAEVVDIEPLEVTHTKKKSD
jgi:UPF0716 protein FxsA